MLRRNFLKSTITTIAGLLVGKDVLAALYKPETKIVGAFQQAPFTLEPGERSFVFYAVGSGRKRFVFKRPWKMMNIRQSFSGHAQIKLLRGDGVPITHNWCGPECVFTYEMCPGREPIGNSFMLDILPNDEKTWAMSIVMLDAEKFGVR